MENRFVEEFFDSGKIMLTTYERCKNHEDSARKDSKEGKCNFHLVHGNYAVSGIHNIGLQSYMLCASTIESDVLMEKFSTDNYLVINNVIAFADAVSRYVPGFTHGKLGACVYKDERAFTKITEKPNTPDSTGLLNAIKQGEYADIEKEFYRMQNDLYNSVENELADESYFLKENSFSEEAEFRIIWGVPRKTSDPVIIACPEAIRYCSPGKPLAKENKPPEFSSDGQMSVVTGFTSPKAG